MKYIQVNIALTHQAVEPVLGELLKLGISDAVIEDPNDVDLLINKENDYDWDYIDQSVLDLKNKDPQISIYFEGNEENLQKVVLVRDAMKELRTLNKKGAFGEEMDFGSLKVEHFIRDDEDWKDNWKEYFKPAKVSNSIVVKPTWENYDKKDGELVIEIDPGMAFGTGTHETTSLCIKMLEKYMRASDKVLDVGCGSGILSMAAALLGSGDILGVDIDPVAVEVAKENVTLNKLEDSIKIQIGDLTKGIDYKGNIVVANLMADLVVMLTTDVARHLEKDGIYISSGIIDEKEEWVVEEIKKCGFTIVEVVRDGMWSAVVAKL